MLVEASLVGGSTTLPVLLDADWLPVGPIVTLFSEVERRVESLDVATGEVVDVVVDVVVEVDVGGVESD